MNETTFASAFESDRVITRASTHRYFYVGIASVLAIIVFVAFTRTYWAPLGQRTLALHPAIQVHAILFFLWTLFFLMQTVLPVRNRTALHRQVGMFGIALAAMMVFSGVLGLIVSLKSGLEVRPQIARTAAALSFGGMTLFTTFISLGIANVLRPERHKRFMVLATFSILQAAIARLIMLIPSIGQPLRITIGTIIVDLMLLTVIAIDSRAQRRIHPVYVGGALFILFVQWARIAVLDTQAWIEFTNWLAAL